MKYQTGTVTTTASMQTVTTDKTPTLVLVYGNATGGNEEKYVCFPKGSIYLYKYGTAYTNGTSWINVVTNGFTIKGFNSGNIGTLRWYAVFDEFE